MALAYIFPVRNLHVCEFYRNVCVIIFFSRASLDLLRPPMCSPLTTSQASTSSCHQSFPSAREANTGNSSPRSHCWPTLIYRFPISRIGEHAPTVPPSLLHKVPFLLCHIYGRLRPKCEAMRSAYCNRRVHCDLESCTALT